MAMCGSCENDPKITGVAGYDWLREPHARALLEAAEARGRLDGIRLARAAAGEVDPLAAARLATLEEDAANGHHQSVTRLANESRLRLQRELIDGGRR